MPRFFFHFRNGSKSLMDCEGVPCANVAAAHHEAWAIAREFAGRSGPGLAGPVLAAGWRDWSIDARDQRGRRVFMLSLDEAIVAANAWPGDAADRPPSRIVHLPAVRASRTHVEQTNRNRALANRTLALFDTHQYTRNGLRHEMRIAREAVRRAREAVARSRARPTENKLENKLEDKLGDKLGDKPENKLENKFDAM
jgi:hypothetical protein